MSDQRDSVGVVTRFTLAVMGGVLVICAVVWFATGGGGGAKGDDDDDGPSPLAFFGGADDNGVDAAIRKMGRIADQICACKDMPCAEGAMKEMSSMKEPRGKPTKAQMDKAMKIAERMSECQKTLMTEDAPDSDF